MAHTDSHDRGFTLIEVLIAASIMIILCVGTLSVFSYAVKLNMGNNLRSQALTVLQAEAEYFRSLKFVPDQSVTDPNLAAHGLSETGHRFSMDGTEFVMSVEIQNVGFKGAVQDESTCTMKQIKIKAVMANPQPGWLSNMRTDITILRVRAN